MNWLKDNLLGMVLVGASGVLVLVALVMMIVWNMPLSVDTGELETENNSAAEEVLVAHQVAAMRDLQVINQKPVFNESRLPEIDDEEEEGDPEENTTVAVKDAPDVRLTGVIITPGMKIASLTPAKGDQESVMAHEGQSLEGEFVGWQVSKVEPRTVLLVSRDGQELELDLQVHDVAIKEPPKPVQKPAAKAERNLAESAVDEDGEPLSRAEQIRQRIAERREELRLEQEAQQAQNNAGQGGQKNADKPPSYQEAIRSMIKTKPKDQDSNDKKDG
jgi:hypothetical protein